MSAAHGVQILPVSPGLCGRREHGGVRHTNRCWRSKGYGHVPRQQRLLPVQRRPPAQPVLHPQLHPVLERRASPVQHGHLYWSHDTGERMDFSLCTNITFTVLHLERLQICFCIFPLRQAYMEDHLRNKDRLQKEWEALCSYQADPSSVAVAQSSSNMDRNRHAESLPC